MVDLGQLSQSNAYAQTSGPGFGTRMLCRPIENEHAKGPTDASMWLTGLRRANALSTNTNPIPNSHMRSPGGFMEFFAGLRDPGDIQFEACWKNDLPAGATAGTASDFQRWQAPKEEDGEGNEGFFHSLFYDRQPFEAWVIPPQWTRGLIIVRGYASMVGPFPHEMEGVINFQGSFKASGKPMILRGVRVADKKNPVSAILANDVVTTADFDPALVLTKDHRFRAISSDLLTEVWSDLITGENVETATWREPIIIQPNPKTWNVYEYTEDVGFGDAF